MMNYNQRIRNGNIENRFVLGTFLLLSFLLLLNPLSGQNGVACNDLVQISVNSNCIAVVLPDMILENSGPDADYLVRIREADGTYLPFDTLTNDYINDTLTAEVTHIASKITCWGYILLEDKIPPVIDECIGGIFPPDTFPCRFYPDGLDTLLTLPTATDNCTDSADIVISYIDEVESDMCGSGGFSNIVTRTWTATDKGGSIGTCTQLLYIRTATFDDLTFPPNYDIGGFPHLPVIECDDPLVPFLSNGCPDPEYTGYPDGLQCANLKATFHDIPIRLCGNGKKCIRQWHVLDWCTGEEFIHNQLIVVMDTKPPEVPLEHDTLYYQNKPGHCYGDTITLPGPLDIIDCSDYTYTVSYKIKDEHGVLIDEYITDNIISRISDKNNNLIFRIFDLPVDTTWIKYTLTDKCGNSSDAFTEIIIQDNEPPSAICDGFTVVALDRHGWAEIQAISFNDHSHDNCAVVDFKVKRLESFCNELTDMEFGDEVEFCCSDVGQLIKVVLRVYDAGGLYSDCIISAKVQDEFRMKSCPNDTIIHCTVDYSNPATFNGYPVLDAYCNKAFVWHDLGFQNECGSGTILRDWYMKNEFKAIDSTYLCTQKIILRDTTLFGLSNIFFPNDTIINGCTVADAPMELMGEPEMYHSACSNIVASYDDKMYYGIEGYCSKLIRTWTIVDWCNFDSKFPNNYIWKHNQKIILLDTIKPVFNQCIDKVGLASQNCEGFIELEASAIDDCTSAEELKYWWQVDLFYSADIGFRIDQTNTGRVASGVYPVGTHKIKFFVEDNCGNLDVCEYSFTIKDNKAPTPVCIGEISLSLDVYGEIEIWAKDFDASSTDGCSNDANLRFSFSENVNYTSYRITCDDLPNGVYGNVLLNVWVTDVDNNQDYCEVRVLVTDNKHACADAPGFRAAIGGIVLDQNKTPLKEVMVKLKNTTVDEEMSYATGFLGEFNFDGLNYLDHYVIQPQSEGNALQGVSTLDIILIQRHILGIKELKTGYKKIAADVNKSGKISTSDIVELRKIILGVIDEFSNSNSWRFVDASYDLSKMNNPSDYPEEMLIDTLSDPYVNVDFVALKVGDVSGNAVYGANANIEGRNNKSLTWVYKPIVNLSGEVTELQIFAEENIEIYGFQGALSTKGLNKATLESSLFDFSRAEWITQDNKLKISHASLDLINIKKGDLLFSIKLSQALSKDELSLSLALDIPNQIYSDTYESYDIQLLKQRKESHGVEEYELFQNTPNPFNDYTMIGFSLPIDSEVAFTVYNTQGNVIKKFSKNYNKGFHQIKLSKQELKNKGLLYYQLETNDYKAIKKMMIID